MAKFKNGNLELKRNEKIILDGNDIVYADSDGSMSIQIRNKNNQTADFFVGKEIANLNDLVLSSTNDIYLSAGVADAGSLYLPGEIRAGQKSGISTQLHLYGGASTGGGYIELWVGTGGSSKATSYKIYSTANFGLLLGPDHDPDSLRYSDALQKWQFSDYRGFDLFGPGNDAVGSISVGRDVANLNDLILHSLTSDIHLSAGNITIPKGQLNVGKDGSDDIGTVSIYGDSSGNGPVFSLMVDDTSDDIVDSYQLQCIGADLWLGADTQTNLLKYVVSTDTWDFTGNKGIKIGSHQLFTGQEVAVLNDLVINATNSIHLSAGDNPTEVLYVNDVRQTFGPSGGTNITLRRSHSEWKLNNTQMIWMEWSGRQLDLGDPAFFNAQFSSTSFVILDGNDSNKQYLNLGGGTARIGGTGTDQTRVSCVFDSDGWVEGAWQTTRLFRFKEEINGSNLPAFQLGSSQWIDTISNDDLLTAGPSAISTTESIRRFVNTSVVSAATYTDMRITSVSGSSEEADNRLREEFGWTYETITTTTTGISAFLATAIPSNVKSIEILSNGVSTNTNSQPPIFRLGTRAAHSDGVADTGYVGVVRGPTGETSVTTDIRPFRSNSWASGDLLNCRIRLTRWDESLHIWFIDCVANDASQLSTYSGKVTLEDELTSVYITTLDGVATLDAGAARVRYRNTR